MDPDTTPPLVALHQITVVALTLKIDWRFALDLTGDGSTEGSTLDPELIAGLVTVIEHARDQGHIRPNVQTQWVIRVYLALMHEAAVWLEGEDVHTRAKVVVDTLINGVGT